MGRAVREQEREQERGTAPVSWQACVLSWGSCDCAHSCGQLKRCMHRSALLVSGRDTGRKLLREQVWTRLRKDLPLV